MMDLVSLAQQRLDYFQTYLDDIPDEFKPTVDAFSTGVDLQLLDSLVDLELNLSEVPPWAVKLINLARWYPGVVPGEKQLQTDEQRTQFRKMKEVFLSMMSEIESTDFGNINHILMRIVKAFEKNQWVLDFLREDQIFVVNQARQYLAHNAAAYTATFYQTKEAFSSIEANLKTFLNNPTLLQDLNNCNLVEAPTGTGKCLGVNTPVIMANGDIKLVQDIQINERVMGPDGKGRTVLALGCGRSELYKITPTKGDSYVVNDEHLLSLVKSGKRDGLILSDGSRIEKDSIGPHFIKARTLHESKDYLKTFLCGWRPEAVSFENENTIFSIPPYILGVWLGDGSHKDPELSALDGVVADEWCKYAISIGHRFSRRDNGGECPTWRIKGPSGGSTNLFLNNLRLLNLIGNKHIPKSYLIASQENRLELLAGLLDTDGYIDNKGFEITQKNNQIAESIVFLCRSLGLAAYSKKSFVRCQNFDGGWYNRIYISGDCDKIPVRDPKKKAPKRNQIKDPLKIGIKIESAGFGDYFGFTLDGDSQFLLGDWQVTHNTRISLITNLNRFSWTNDLAVNTLAADQMFVFVRTRSQTMSFIKESNRLGLTVACPISQALGCEAHNNVNKLLFANLENIVYRLSNKHSFQELWIPKSVPIELYDYNLKQESDDVAKFGKLLRSIIVTGLKHPEMKNFLAALKKEHVEAALMDCFKDTGLKRDMLEYLSHTTENCGSCKSALMQVDKANKANAFSDAEYFPGTQSQHFNFNSAGKNVDINLLAHQYQGDKGWCGRKASQEKLESKDVVILTYNWLTDVDLQKQLLKRFIDAYKDEDNPDRDILFLEKSVVCDEAHTLYNYNYTFSFGLSDIVQTFVELQKIKLILSYPQYKLRSVDLLVPNPHYCRYFKPIRLVRLNPESAEKTFETSSDFLGSAWATLHNIGEGIYQILKHLNSQKNKDPLITNLFGSLIGRSMLPWKIYNSFDDENSSFKMDFETGDLSEKIKVCYNQLTEVYYQIDYLTTHFELEKKARETDLFTLLIPESMAGGKPLSDFRKAWDDFPDKERVTIRKYVDHLKHLYVDPIQSLAKIASSFRDFLLLSLEVLYSGSGDKSRILAIGSEDDDRNGLDYRYFDKFKLQGLEAPMDITPAYLENTFKSYGFDEILGSKGNIYIDSSRLKGYYRKVSCSLKVNRPAIQWALRPFPYVTFLTGTAPPPSIWKCKSGFNQFNVSQYPNQMKPFEFEFVTDVTLTFANRSRENFKKLATHIYNRTQAGQTLVCYPSGKVLEEIRKVFEEDYMDYSKYLDGNLFETKAAKLSLDDIQKYVEKNETGSVHVVMGGKYVEGIEFTDDSGSSLIKQVIIVGVPFNPPSEELTQVEEYYQKVFGWNQWDCRRAFWYGPVFEKVRQAVGRSVRNLTDRSKVVFMDSRYVTDQTLRSVLNLF